MWSKHRAALFAGCVVLAVAPAHAQVVLMPLSGALLAQAETPSDPFIEQVNAELDGTGASDDAANAVQDANRARGGLYYLRVISALCLVVALILAVGYAIRRAGGSSPLLAGPSLGRILGRIYLSRNATLYFVETGGRVLVLGTTSSAVNTVASFDAATFGDEAAEAVDDGEPESDQTASFLRELGRQTESFQAAGSGASESDIDSLRQDIERLQEYLREDSGEIRD